MLRHPLAVTLRIMATARWLQQNGQMGTASLLPFLVLEFCAAWIWIQLFYFPAKKLPHKAGSWAGLGDCLVCAKFCCKCDMATLVLSTTSACPK